MENDTIMRVVNNVNILLKNRGHNIENINMRIPKYILLDRIERFKKDNTSLDILITSPRKAYVKFLDGSLLSDKVQSTIQSLDKIYNTITDAYRFNNDDEFIFVILGEIKSDIYSLENQHSNLTIFNHKKLLINIVDNIYVPKHIKLSIDEKKNLKNKLNIDSFNDLPILFKSDAISRYYNFREGDVIKIERPSKGNKTHIAYRYVVSDSF
tara:strand:- start:928 stop:1560 length:633 start_codon:yes stop_codon:yes gene_type:complete